MAASHTLSHPPASPQISRLGVLTLHGYGIRITMQAGHLQIEDGIGPERRKFRLPRVNHRLKRLVCIGDDGFITLSALTWLSDVGASFVMLNRLGKVRVMTGPTSPSEARLRRTQALALGNGTAARIARELISVKLKGQETLVREKLKNISSARSIAEFQVCLASADEVDTIRGIESRAAAEYWSAWRDVPVLFARKDINRIPIHWVRFGTRHSPLTGGPRLSVNPANSLLNYANAVAESECRLAASACGLDPGMGFLHTDTANRDSLALDLIETIRPAIEAWLLDWLMREPLRRSDFSEAADGNCRISSDLCSKLSETAPTWGRLVAPWAEYVAHSLYCGRSAQAGSVSGLKTPLTQRHRREAKRGPAPIFRMPKTEHVCRGCGKPIRREHDECSNCAVSSATGRLVNAARIGRISAQTPEARTKHAESARSHALARASWNDSDQPAWLTSEFFSQKVQPLLSKISTRKIRSRIGVSRWYAGKIRQGYPPKNSPKGWDKEIPQWIYEMWDYIVRGALGLKRKKPSWIDIPQMMRLNVSTYNVLKMLAKWQRARPYNFLLLPMVDPLFGYAFHRRSNDKILLVCPFSSDQEHWFGLECINVHDGKKYRMLDCKENKIISYNVVFPSQFSRLLIDYQEHPEAKSLAPDGTPCKADTRGLLKRTNVIAGEFRYIGKETDRKWEEGDEISILEFKTAEYGRSRKVIATEELKKKILEIGINKCARESGFDRKNFIRKLIRGIPVKRNSYEEFVRWLGGYPD